MRIFLGLTWSHVALVCSGPGVEVADSEDWEWAHAGCRLPCWDSGSRGHRLVVGTACSSEG